MSYSKIPEEMILLGEFAKRKKITPDQASDMVRDGIVEGQEIDGSWYVKTERMENPGRAEMGATNYNYPPPLAVVFYVFALLSAVGALILATEFWPARTAYGRSLPVEAYTWSLIWITIGVLQAALLSAIGTGLWLLKEIAYNTRRA